MKEEKKQDGRFTDVSEKLTNPIQEYFANQSENEKFLSSRELFRADNDVDIKTEVELDEIQYITTLLYNNDLLKSKGLKPVYKDFLNNYLRLKISLKRKSRTEFVDMNKQQDASKLLQDASNLKSSYGDAKK